MTTNLDIVLSSVFVIMSLFKRDGVGVATTEDWIVGYVNTKLSVIDIKQYQQKKLNQFTISKILQQITRIILKNKVQLQFFLKGRTPLK